MSEQDLRALLQKDAPTPSLQPVAPGVEPSSPAPSGATPSLTPKTDAALGQIPQAPSPIGDVLKPLQDAEAQRKSDLIKQIEEPGAPADIETGGSPWERFWVGSMRDKENALAYMQRKHGSANVKMVGDDFAFKVTDKSGSQKWVKFRPDTTTIGDLADLAAAGYEIGGSILGIMLGRKIPKVGAAKGILGLTRDVLTGAAGAEAVGGAKDIAQSLGYRGTLDVGEIASERGKMGATDVALGYGTYGLGRFFKFLGSPFAGSRGPIQFNMAEAQKYFAEHPRYRQAVEASASELTGSPILGRSEVYTEIQPGGYGPLKELKERQEKQLLNIQKIMTGGSPPPDEQIAKRMEQALETQISPAEESVRAGQKELKEAGTKGIENIATALTSPDRQIYRDVLGKELRGRVSDLAQSARSKAEAAYEAAKQIHPTDEKIFDGGPLQAKLKQIISELPSAKVTKEVDTGLVDEFGKPITATGQEKQLLEKWPPEKLLPRLREIISLKDPKFSYWDLKNMRRDIYDDLTKSEAVPDMGAHYLSEIGKAITESMEQIKKEMPAPFKTAIEKADELWKKEVMPFDRPGIRELFRREGETGFIPNDQVISRIFSTADSPSVSIQNWNLMRETLGAGSPEFAKLKRGLVDHIIESSRESGEEFIDPSALTRSLTDLRTNYRTISDEVFGTKLNKLFQEAKFIDYGKNPKIANEDLQALLADPSPTKAKLQSLVNKQKVLDSIYRNDILKSVADNRFPTTAQNPREFVSRFLDNPSTSPSDVRQVMGMLQNDPQLVEDIQSKLIESLFQKAGKRIGASDISRLFAGQSSQVASGAGLVKELQVPNALKKFETILGPQKFEELRQYANLIAGTEYKYAASGYAMAGAFAATHTVKALESLQLLKFAKPTLANWFVAKTLTNPLFRAWASHVPTNPDPGAVSLFLSSPAFLKQVSKDFPSSTVGSVVGGFKDAMDQWVRQGFSKEPPAPKSGFDERRQMMQEFLKKNPPKPQAQSQEVSSPAIQVAGRTVEGKDHVRAYAKAKRTGTPDTSGAKEGFTTDSGEFVSRETAADMSGLETNVEPGKLHSSDLALT